jgi:NDP-sugar pyrophosphorylase family protein
MQIVIPMSGVGQRFVDAGYNVPKPLIVVNGKPIIHHVIDLFPNETNFIFVCNKDHLSDDKLKMKQIILEYCPSGLLVEIEPHKLGPVHAVEQIKELLDPNMPVVVNYCDFSCYWDWAEFLTFVETHNLDGCIPSYRGFHPHSFGSTNYAYLKMHGAHLKDIQEKQPFTDCKSEEYASSGCYYFKSTASMFAAFEQVRAQDLSVNGEYYVSMAYKILVSQGAKVGVYELEHFMQWGTPQDLEEYKSWSDTFEALVCYAGSAKVDGGLVMPMAGSGQRFLDKGYSTSKPLIEVAGAPMFKQALKFLPKFDSTILVVQDELLTDISTVFGCDDYAESIKTVSLPEKTSGQAVTARLGLRYLENVDNDWIHFAACDSGALIDVTRYQATLSSEEFDIIVWGKTGYSNAMKAPKMYGWVDEVDGLISHIGVKKAPKFPENTPIVLGTFAFRNKSIFLSCYNSMLRREGLVNDEYYIDEMINDAVDLGLKCKLFEVDHYICWGTPIDLETFNYWQSCFNKWASHPYEISRDYLTR